MLENEFVNEYREGDRVFYVSLTNNEGSQSDVSNKHKDIWSVHWQHANDVFEKLPCSYDNCISMRGKIFSVLFGKAIIVLLHRVAVSPKNMQMNRSGISPLIVYVSTIPPQLLCY